MSPSWFQRRGVSRRQFLTAGTMTGAALACEAMMPARVWAHTVSIPTDARARRLTPDAWIPEPPPAELFRQVAAVAMDAARAAGAEYADIRIGVQRRISIPKLPWSPSAGMTVGYGVRARVDGTWSFQSGNLVTTDAVVGAARSAVLGAQMYAKTNAQLGRPRAEPPAPTPVVTGEWRGPVGIDPFTVPIDDYYRIVMSYTDMVAPIARHYSVSGVALGWNAETRVFASTDGSLVTQHFMRGGPGLGGNVRLERDPRDRVDVDIPKPWTESAGFELALRPGLVESVAAGIDDAIRLCELPYRKFTDIGRFPIVFGGQAFAKLAGYAASMTLDGDRASGIEADASGSTFLAPPDDFLGKTPLVFSKLLTVTSDRSLPSPMAVQWDDEGVVPEPYTVIRDGEIVDYHTTRDTAPLLAGWYQRRGQPVRSHGGALAGTPASLPAGTAGHLHITPAAGRVDLETLMRDIKHGFVIRDGFPWHEPNLTSGAMPSQFALEVRDGKPVARTNVFIQFTTKTLLNAKLAALGDASTVRTNPVVALKGVPWQGILQLVDAPAALCKDVDVVSWEVRG